MPDLTAADFAVFEEGRRQAISHFASGDAAIDVGFLLDTSSSMRDNLRSGAESGTWTACSGSGTAIVRPSLASGRPFRFTSR